MTGKQLKTKDMIRYASYGCIAVMSASVIYAIARFYVFFQRVDLSIILVNVVLFAIIAGVLIYLSKRQKDIEEEEMFRD